MAFKIIIILSLITFHSWNVINVCHGESNVDERGTLDGVYVKAIETYPNPKTQEFNFGVGLYPYNAYYSGFGLGGSFTYYFNKTWAWDIVNGMSFFSFDKDLISVLAEDFGVEPEQIERIKFLVGSNLKYVHSYGKLIFLKKFIRYYRSSFIFGVGLASTNERSYFTGNFGFDINFFVNDSFSVKFEACDSMALNGSSIASPNYIVVKIVTGISY